MRNKLALMERIERANAEHIRIYRGCEEPSPRDNEGEPLEVL